MLCAACAAAMVATFEVCTPRCGSNPRSVIDRYPRPSTRSLPVGSVSRSTAATPLSMNSSNRRSRRLPCTCCPGAVANFGEPPPDTQGRPRLGPIGHPVI